MSFCTSAEPAGHSMPASVSRCSISSRLNDGSSSTSEPSVKAQATKESLTYDVVVDSTQDQFYVDQPVAPGTYTGPIDASLPDADKVPLLFQPFTIKDLTIPNRVVVAPMCMFSSADGFFTDFHLVHLGSFAVSGAGLVIAEGTGVSPNGRISPTDTGLWKDEHIPGLKRIADFVHAQGSKLGIQIAHAGRKVMAYPATFDVWIPWIYWRKRVMEEIY